MAVFVVNLRDMLTLFTGQVFVAIIVLVGGTFGVFGLFIARLWADRQPSVCHPSIDCRAVAAIDKRYQTTVEDIVRATRTHRAFANELERTSYNSWKVSFLARRTQFYKDIGFGQDSCG